MAKNKKILSILALLMASSIIVPLTGCGDNSFGSMMSSSIDNTIAYEIKIVNLSNVGLSATIQLIKDNKVVVSQTTDETGKAILNAEPGVYEIKVTNLPMGYYLDKNYTTDNEGTPLTIVCSSSVVNAEIPKNKKYKLGDIIYDFSVVTSDNTNFKISEALKSKKMVMINFWATWCTYCMEELPFMNEAYDMYKNDVSIIALSNYDTNSKIAELKTQSGLSFDMAYDVELLTHFDVEGLPVSVIVDRYGMIVEIHTGAFDNAQDFTKWFEKYTTEDYKPDEGLTGDNSTDDEEEEIRVKPNVSQPSSSELESVANGEGFDGHYSPEDNPNDAEYSWPWIVAEDGESIRPSNKGIDNSFAMVYTTITLNENQAFAFDYKSSSESGGDILFIIVDGDILYSISGVSSTWETCYAYVALEKGEHEVCFCFIKDTTLESGDDTVYIKYLRFLI